MSGTMRAVGHDELGGPEVLRVVELDRPQPGPTEILVRVHAAGINPADWKTRGWGGLSGAPAALQVLGYDVSGVVEAVGYGVTLFQPGDEVFGMVGFPKLLGAYAEFIAGPARHFVHKPAGIDHVQAAALPLVSLTAWQAFVDRADLQPGQRVLVHAGAGGVGHVAVQIAKALGAYVIATASAGKHEFVRGLGADEVIDYTAVDFATVVADVDVVLETVGDDYSERSLPALKDGGTLISLTHPKDDALIPVAAERGIKAGFMLVEPDRRALLAVADLVESGQLRVEVAAVLPLEEAAKAHELGETGRTVGKIVLKVDQ